MNEEVFQPPDDAGPLIGALYAACDMFLMDDTYMLRKCRRLDTAGINSDDGPSSLLSTYLASEEGEKSQEKPVRARKRGTIEGEALMAFKDNQFRIHFRMNADTFEMLCSVLSHHVKENPSRGRKPVPLDRKVN